MTERGATDDAEHTPRARAITGATFVACWIVVAFFGFVHIHHGGFPEGGGPMSSAIEDRVASASGIQESWQFFEKDLRAEQVFVLAKDGASWREIAPVANAEPRNLFGVGRGIRKDAVERNRVVALVGKGEWVRCESELADCIDRAQKVTEIANPAPHPAYCGSFVIARKLPVSWAFAKTPHPSQTIMVARVEIRC